MKPAPREVARRDTIRVISDIAERLTAENERLTAECDELFMAKERACRLAKRAQREHAKRDYKGSAVVLAADLLAALDGQASNEEQR